jgi:hypothetical protein
MNPMTYEKFALHLLLLALFCLVTAISQPAAAQAQAPITPTGTGKTLNAVLLGTATALDEGPQHDDLQADEPNPDSAAKIPGIHKVSDVTLKRGQIG